MLKNVAADQTHPPGYFALLWIAHQLGIPIVWERSLSVVATAVVAAGVFLYARRIVPFAGALVAGLVVVLGWQFVRHNWELRPYSLLALVSFAAVWTLEWAARDPTRTRLLALVGVVAIGSMTHYFFVFTVVAAATWLFVSRIPARRRLAAALAAGLAPLVLWLPGFVKQYQHRRFQTLGGFSPRRVFTLYADLLERSLPAHALGLALAGGVLVVVAFGAARLWGDAGRGRLCALAATIPLVVAAAVWLLGPHIFVPRNLIGSLPFVAIAIGAALTSRARVLEAALAAAAVALLAVGFVRARGRIVPDYDRVAAALVAERWRPEDPILLFGPPYAYLHPLDWYLPGEDRLELANPASGRCDTVFIVAVGGRARALTTRLGARARRVHSTVIGSFAWRPSIWQETSRRGGFVLGTRRSPCLRIPSGR